MRIGWGTATFLLALFVHVGQSKCAEITNSSATTLPSPANPPTIENFNGFISSLVSELQKRDDDENAAAPVDVSVSTEQKYSDLQYRFGSQIHLLNTDLKKTDSLVNPIVGVALIKTETSTEIIRAKQNEGYDYRQYEWLITFAPSNGRWKPIRWTSKLVDSSDKNDSGLGIEKKYGIPSLSG